VKLTFLGTGTSFGVPQVGCRCAVCRSTDPRDRRTRTGAVIETDGGTRLLVDTPPELRLQLISTGIDRVDAVLYTHDHADHVHGLDDLRAVSVRRGDALPIYGAADTLERIAHKFPYVFDAAMRPQPGTTKPEGALHAIEPGPPTRIGDADVVVVPVPHGAITVYAYRVGPIGYVTDAKAIPPDALALLAGVRVLVVNGLFWTPHPTHLSIPEAIEASRAIGAERTYLTHLTHDNAHAELAARLPSGVEPAYDGLVVTV